jgi:hypothetical protein
MFATSSYPYIPACLADFIDFWFRIFSHFNARSPFAAAVDHGSENGFRLELPAGKTP